MTGCNTRAVVLAAGKATRFKTKKSKLLFNICGQAMILYPLRALEALDIPVSLVLGYQAAAVQNEIEQAHVKDVTCVVQEQQLGTAHAVACTQSTWDKEDILILYGDMPLITKELIKQLLADHKVHNSTITFFTAYVIDPTGYGRVIEHEGKIKIIEENDCNDEQRNINRINAGVYVMKRAFLDEYLASIKKSAVTGELYLPDLILLACDAGLPVHAISVPYDNVRGVNTLQELWGVEQIKRSESIKYWMARGVRFELAQSIHIDMNVEIGAGSFIGTGVHLLGNTKIGEECFVGAFTIIEETVIGDSTTIHSHSIIQDSTIGDAVHVGPFARLRDNVTIEDKAEIGNFVEVKNSQIGQESKAKHLSYIGDARVGSNANIGAGTITCNYNGVTKGTTIIEDGAFIGSNNTLVAPVQIGKGAYTAAGSAITQDVPADALAIGRTRQINKNGYAKKMRETLMQRSGKKSPTEKIPDLFEKKEEEEFQFRGAVKTESNHKAGF